MKYFSVLLAAMLAFSAQAQSATATVSWINPTTNTNGTPIPATGTAGSLVATRVEWGSCSGTNVFGVKAGETLANAPATSVLVPSLLDATTYCFRVFARNTYGAESAASNVASKMTPTPVPNPPVLSATITVAYEVVITSWGEVRLGRNVGTLAVGTACMDNPLQTNKGEYYEVGLDKVKLTRMPKSAIVVTKCAWS